MIVSEAGFGALAAANEGDGCWHVAGSPELRSLSIQPGASFIIAEHPKFQY